MEFPNQWTSLDKATKATLQGICDSNPQKLLWEHESQIRLYRTASLSYTTPEYIYCNEIVSEDIFLLRAP